MEIYEKRLSRQDLESLTGELSAIGGVRRVVLDDGAERGIRALEFRTGTGLSFDVLVDRAMDIGQAEFQGRSFGWRSAVGLRHPGLHEPSGEDGLSWLRSVTGLIATAGLDHTMYKAEVDASEYGLPSRKSIRHSLHGRIANTPARLVGYGESWDSDRCILRAEGVVRQAALFGENLELHRRIESDLGSSEIRIFDTVRNCGFDRTPHMYLYHINFGWPLLDQGSRFIAPIVKTRWRSETTPEHHDIYDSFPGPLPGCPEQVYEHELAAKPDGRTNVLLANDRLHFGVEVEWRMAELPCFIQWLYLREGAYVLGVEPSTHHIQGNLSAREDGSMIWLNHGDSRTYHLTLKVLSSKATLDGAASRIQSSVT